MLDIFTRVIMGLMLVSILAAAFMMIRNEWLYRALMKLIHEKEGTLKFSQFPSYPSMLYRFWRWDVNGFLPKE